MTDIARGPGGDGSPQLDLDAIETRFRASADHSRRKTYTSTEWLSRAAADGDALMALVRRLQQENEELRVGRTWTAEVIAAAEKNAKFIVENDALRGRVEELTEALRALMAVIDGPVEWGSWRGIATGTDTPAFMQARRLLARVVPEKETP